jgi:hypothetical protein
MDTTAAYDPWDPSEEPVVEYSEYYDPFSGEPCYEIYKSCIAKCRRVRNKVNRLLCFSACANGTVTALRSDGFHLRCGRAATSRRSCTIRSLRTAMMIHTAIRREVGTLAVGGVVTPSIS